jgi:hypothetical protein
MLAAFVWIYIPQFNERYPIKSFAAAVNATVGLNQPLQLCGSLNDLALRVNVGRFVPVLPELAEVMRYLEGDGEVFCVIESEAYQQLIGLSGQPIAIVAGQKFDRTMLLLISNRQR